MEREEAKRRQRVRSCLGKARGGNKGDDGSSSEITCNSGGGRMCTGKGILKGVGVYTSTFLRWGFTNLPYFSSLKPIGMDDGIKFLKCRSRVWQWRMFSGLGVNGTDFI